MELNELRLGNFVRQGKVLEIRANAVKLKYFAENLKNSLITYENVKPIKLTEEWLLKLGFVKGKDVGIYNNVFYLEGFYISLSEYINIFVDWNDDTNEPTMFYEVCYVHQLQNLYFALTGKELTI